MGYNGSRKIISVWGAPWKEGWDEFLIFADGCEEIPEDGGDLIRGWGKISGLGTLRELISVSGIAEERGMEGFGTWGGACENFGVDSVLVVLLVNAQSALW
jgi:hypothetical protein